MRSPFLPFFTDRIHYVMSVHYVKRYTQDGDALRGISFSFCVRMRFGCRGYITVLFGRKTASAVKYGCIAGVSE